MIWSASYAMRDTVKRALDVATTTRVDAQVDRLIQASSRTIESACNRVFWPKQDTRYFDWPINYSGSGGRPWQIWLDANELITLTSVSAGSVNIPTQNVFTEPINYGPPYTRLEINLNSSSSFSGATTWQRAVAVTGLYGYRNDETPAGALAAAVTDTTSTSVTATDSSVVSPGAIIRVDNERMLVSDVAMTATGVTYTGPNTANVGDNQLNVGASISGFNIGETLLLDTERMLVTDIQGQNLVVKRAWDGTILDLHSNAPISAARKLTVARGFGGTTPAAHTNSTTVVRHTSPALVEQTCIGLTLYGLGTELAGVRPQALAPAGKASAKPSRIFSPVDALLADLVGTYGRKARTRAI